MKKALITGATGFIGNYVIQKLLKKDWHIIATSPSEERATQTDWFAKVSFIEFDVKQFDKEVNYFNFFQQPDLMIHLAWEGLPNYKSSFHLDENLPRHLNLLSNLIKNGLKNLTVTGTCLEYGMQEGALKEILPVFPSNPYAIAKNELRISLELLQRDHLFSFKWVRLFYTFGKGQNPNSLLSQLDNAIANGAKIFNMTGGEQVRDYLPVEKVAEYIVKIALEDKASGIINCCSGQPIAIKDFVREYLKKINKHISLNMGFYPYPNYEPMCFWGDDTKLKTILNNE